MTTPEHYRTLAKRCRSASESRSKIRDRSSPYLLSLADHFEESARVAEKALAGDKPSSAMPNKIGPAKP
jgi:hypothetical protein